MIKWLRVENASGEQLILASEVASVKKVGRTVTFITKSNGIFNWVWNGTAAEWAKLIGGLGLDNAI